MVHLPPSITVCIYSLYTCGPWHGQKITSLHPHLEEKHKKSFAFILFSRRCHLPYRIGPFCCRWPSFLLIFLSQRGKGEHRTFRSIPARFSGFVRGTCCRMDYSILASCVAIMFNKNMINSILMRSKTYYLSLWHSFE